MTCPMPASVAPAEQVLDLRGADPVPVVGVDVAHLPGPPPVAVAHDPDVARRRLARERARSRALVDASRSPNVTPASLATWRTAREWAARCHGRDPVTSPRSLTAQPTPGGSTEPRVSHGTGRDGAPVPERSRTGAVTDPDYRRSVRDAEPGLERVSSAQSTPGSLSPNLLEPLDDLRDLGPPLVDVDPQRRLEIGSGHVEARRRRARPAVGTWPIGVSTAAARALQPLHDPLEHPRVLAEAGPQEPAAPRRAGTS